MWNSVKSCLGPKKSPPNIFLVHTKEWVKKKENELKIRQKLLTAVSPWFLSVYGITHFSVGIIVENGSDLTENWKAIEGRCTVRWVRTFRHLAWGLRGVAYILGLHMWQNWCRHYISETQAMPSGLQPLGCWCIHSLSHLSLWFHQWSCSCS